MFYMFADLYQNHDFVQVIYVNIYFLFDIKVPRINFSKLHPTLQGKPDNTGLTLWIEQWLKSEEIYHSYWWASDVFLHHRDLTVRHVLSVCSQMK